jgi:thymidylate synthase (FAD)
MQTCKLISWSQPNPEHFQEHFQSQDLIAYMARVSNPKNQDNQQTAQKLLKYLVDNKHWSPLEMVSICIEINTTRDIARQILRHRSFSFQEYSQRYANPLEDLEWCIRAARRQDHKNRQASVALDLSQDQDRIMLYQWQQLQQQLIDKAQQTYQWAIEKGIAKECARAVLPEGLISSRLYMHGTLRSWLHYCELRTDMSTQLEHREIALQCKQLIETKFAAISSV